MSRRTLWLHKDVLRFAYMTITFYGQASQPILLRTHFVTLQLWADPVSLAATKGIAFAFFSSRY